jgi:hypothetical protein
MLGVLMLRAMWPDTVRLLLRLISPEFLKVT